MNFKTVLVIASLVLTAGLTSCKGAEPEAPKTETTAPAADVKPVEAPKGDAMKPDAAKTEAPKGDVKPDAAKKDEKKAN